MNLTTLVDVRDLLPVDAPDHLLDALELEIDGMISGHPILKHIIAMGDGVPGAEFLFRGNNISYTIAKEEYEGEKIWQVSGIGTFSSLSDALRHLIVACSHHIFTITVVVIL